VLTGSLAGGGVNGLDALGAVDALQVNGRDAEVAVAELALDDISGTPSRASSTASACRSWWGATPKRTSMNTAAAAGSA
jgi:hypothetical protein